MNRDNRDREEQDFLHDLAGPTNSLGILLEILNEELLSIQSDSKDQYLNLISQALLAHGKIEDLIKKRRDSHTKKGS